VGQGQVKILLVVGLASRVGWEFRLGSAKVGIHQIRGNQSQVNPQVPPDNRKRSSRSGSSSH
jgi:hypothetical protein